MTVTFPPEVEEKVLAAAAQNGLEPDAYVRAVMQKEMRLPGEPNSDAPDSDAMDADYDPEALARAVAALSQRTPAQLEAAQARAIREFRPKIALPPDVSPLEVMPVIRGDETDEEVRQALRELS